MDDAVIAYFIGYFYNSLTDGLNCYEALAAAQRELRDYSEISHTYCWVGFFILGEGKLSPKLARRNRVLLLRAGALALSLLFLGFRRHSRPHAA